MKYNASLSCSSISNVIAWLEKQKERYGEVDVRLTHDWMEINSFGYIDPNDEENPQWVKDNLGNIKKPFVTLIPANSEYNYDIQKTVRYSRSLTAFGLKTFIKEIKDKLGKLETGELTVEQLKTEYLDIILKRVEEPRKREY